MGRQHILRPALTVVIGFQPIYDAENLVTSSALHLEAAQRKYEESMVIKHVDMQQQNTCHHTHVHSHAGH